jgi:hypothetical protein
MLSVLRPSFEVVKDGRILNKMRNLQHQFVSAFLFGACLKLGFKLSKLLEFK